MTTILQSKEAELIEKSKIKPNDIKRQELIDQPQPSILQKGLPSSDSNNLDQWLKEQEEKLKNEFALESSDRNERELGFSDLQILRDRPDDYSSPANSDEIRENNYMFTKYMTNKQQEFDTRENYKTNYPKQYNEGIDKNTIEEVKTELEHEGPGAYKISGDSIETDTQENPRIIRGVSAHIPGDRPGRMGTLVDELRSPQSGIRPVDKNPENQVLDLLDISNKLLVELKTIRENYNVPGTGDQSSVNKGALVESRNV